MKLRDVEAVFRHAASLEQDIANLVKRKDEAQRQVSDINNDLPGLREQLIAAKQKLRDLLKDA